MTEPVNTHFWTMRDGPYRGRAITRVPADYLRKMVKADHEHADIARAELERREPVPFVVNVSPHAIDRASVTCLRVWRKDRRKEEGLYSWLARVAEEAWALRVPAAERERRKHKGMRFVFREDRGRPVLVTVVRLTVPTKVPPRRAA